MYTVLFSWTKLVDEANKDKFSISPQTLLIEIRLLCPSQTEYPESISVFKTIESSSLPFDIRVLSSSPIDFEERLFRFFTRTSHLMWSIKHELHICLRYSTCPYVHRECLRAEEGAGLESAMGVQCFYQQLFLRSENEDKLLRGHADIPETLLVNGPPCSASDICVSLCKSLIEGVAPPTTVSLRNASSISVLLNNTWHGEAQTEAEASQSS